MRPVLLCLLVLAACKSDDSGDYPVRPGGGGGGGGGGGDDEPPADARMTIDGGDQATGRVCVIDDLRHWSTGCLATGAQNLMVTIGTETALTTANGGFTINRPTGTPLVVRVEGTGIATSLNPYDSTALSIDAVAPHTTAFNALLAASSISPSSGTGTLMVDLRFNGLPQAGILADSNPAPGAGAGGVFYDNLLDQDAWDTDATDVDSKALFADLTPGAVIVNAAFMTSGGAGTFTVEDGAITFGRISIVP